MAWPDETVEGQTEVAGMTATQQITSGSTYSYLGRKVGVPTQSQTLKLGLCHKFLLHDRQLVSVDATEFAQNISSEVLVLSGNETVVGVKEATPSDLPGSGREIRAIALSRPRPTQRKG